MKFCITVEKNRPCFTTAFPAKAAAGCHGTTNDFPNRTAGLCVAIGPIGPIGSVGCVGSVASIRWYLRGSAAHISLCISLDGVFSKFNIFR